MAVRDEKIIVKVSPEIKEKLQTICEEMGVSMSGYVAVMIGQIVRQTTMNEQVVRQVIEQAGMEGMKMAINTATNGTDEG
jgi:predicted transcriptional regulator